MVVGSDDFVKSGPSNHYGQRLDGIRGDLVCLFDRRDEASCLGLGEPVAEAVRLAAVVKRDGTTETPYDPVDPPQVRDHDRRIWS